MVGDIWSVAAPNESRRRGGEEEKSEKTDEQVGQ